MISTTRYWLVVCNFKVKHCNRTTDDTVSQRNRPRPFLTVGKSKDSRRIFFKHKRSQLSLITVLHYVDCAITISRFLALGQVERIWCRSVSVQLLYLNYVTVIQPCTGYLAPDVRPFKIFIPFE